MPKLLFIIHIIYIIIYCNRVYQPDTYLSKFVLDYVKEDDKFRDFNKTLDRYNSIFMVHDVAKNKIEKENRAKKIRTSSLYGSTRNSIDNGNGNGYLNEHNDGNNNEKDNMKNSQLDKSLKLNKSKLGNLKNINYNDNKLTKFNISSNKGIPVYIYSKYIEYPGFQNYDEDDYVKFDDIYEIINKNKKLYNSSNNFKNNFWDDILTKEIKSAELIITDAFKKMGAKDCYGKTSIVKGPEQLIEVIKENYLKE